MKEFNLKKEIYKLAATINHVSINHYRAYVIRDLHENNNLKANISYFLDDIRENNYIKEMNSENEENLINYILNYKPLILFYLKKYLNKLKYI